MNADDLKNFVQSFTAFYLLLHDGHHQVCTDGRPYLAAHGVLASPVKTSQAEMLLDPLEEQFHFPAASVKFGDYQSGQLELIG